MKIIKIVLIVLVVSSCRNNRSEEDLSAQDTTVSTADTATAVAVEMSPFGKLIWAPVLDNFNGDTLKQNRKVNADTLDPQKLIQEINASWEGVVLKLKKISHDTIYVDIPNSTYLTQSMGSTGAENYISSTTYNLTELKNIRFVNYNFEVGDHLSPGTWSRSDFKGPR
jgi:hypothetical protein